MVSIKACLYRKRKAHKTKTGLDRYSDGLLEGMAQLSNEVNIALEYIDASYKKIHFQSSILHSNKYLPYVTANLYHALTPIPLGNKKSTQPFIVTIHDLCPIITPEAYEKHIPFLFKKTIKNLKKRDAFFIVNSINTKNDLLSFCPIEENRVRLTYLGISDNFFSKEKTNSSTETVKLKYLLSERYFLFIGAMNKRKNLDTVLFAFKNFLKITGQNIKLVLAGRMDWGGDEVKKRVEELGINKNVIFSGYIDEEDLSTVINQSLALIYLSKYEGFGFPVLEAMACETLAITSNTSSLPEVAGDAALLVSPENIEEIQNAMQVASENYELRNSLIQKGIVRAKSFTWKNTAVETLQFYREII